MTDWTKEEDEAFNEVEKHSNLGKQILRELGVGKMKLLANPRKMPSMTGFNLEVVGYQASPDH